MTSSVGGLPGQRIGLEATVVSRAKVVITGPVDPVLMWSAFEAAPSSGRLWAPNSFGPYTTCYNRFQELVVVAP
jgi:hypothetical protein